MKISLIVLAVAAALSGCDQVTPSEPDQCLRPVLFQQCMASLPKGPERIAAAGNDWDEVVTECSRTAFQQSIRRPQFIKPECRP